MLSNSNDVKQIFFKRKIKHTLIYHTGKVKLPREYCNTYYSDQNTIST